MNETASNENNSIKSLTFDYLHRFFASLQENNYQNLTHIYEFVCGLEEILYSLVLEKFNLDINTYQPNTGDRFSE